MSISNPQPWQADGLPNVEQILGLAVFDAAGLPCDCFVANQYKDMEWIQMVFQALGLQQLLASSMDLPKLDNVMIRMKFGNIVVVRPDQNYIAFLLKRSLPQERPDINGEWLTWARNFEAKVVRNHPNFKAL